MCSVSFRSYHCFLEPFFTTKVSRNNQQELSFTENENPTYLCAFLFAVLTFLSLKKNNNCESNSLIKRYVKHKIIYPAL